MLLNRNLNAVKDYGKEVKDKFLEGIENTARGKAKLIDFVSDKSSTSKGVKTVADDAIIGKSDDKVKSAIETAEKLQKINDDASKNQSKLFQDAYAETLELDDKATEHKIDNIEAVYGSELWLANEKKRLAEIDKQRTEEGKEAIKQAIIDETVGFATAL